MSSIVHCIRASLCVILLLGASSATAESPVCGDGYLLAPESCDDGNTINELCPYGVSSCEICNDECEIVTGVLQVCGDGEVQDAFESCDHGGELALDCDYGATSCEVCLPHCEIGPGRTSLCGDGNIDNLAGEQCDPSHPNFVTCPYGQITCQTCSNSCELENITGFFCGDNIIQEEQETCDDGNTITERCPTNNPTCQICNSECQIEEGDGSYCGDGIVDTQWNELCDDGVPGIASCPYGETCEYCNDECVFETIRGPFCGDNLIQTQAGENCDDGNTVTDLCPYGESSCLVCNHNVSFKLGKLLFVATWLFRVSLVKNAILVTTVKPHAITARKNVSDAVRRANGPLLKDPFAATVRLMSLWVKIVTTATLLQRSVITKVVTARYATVSVNGKRRMRPHAVTAS